MCDPFEMWLCLYYAQWQCFPIKQLNEAASETIDGLSNDLTKIANDEVHDSKINLTEFATSVGLIQEGDGLEDAKEAVRRRVIPRLLLPQ